MARLKKGNQLTYLVIKRGAGEEGVQITLYMYHLYELE